MKDMYNKGRAVHPVGENSHKAKLTKDEAIYILKNMETITALELSTKFNVCRQTIQNIWNGITKYVEPEVREEIIKGKLHPASEGPIEGFNTNPDEYCQVSGAKLDRTCEHESDGYHYMTSHKPQIHSRKCKKCGEFYR